MIEFQGEIHWRFSGFVDDIINYGVNHLDVNFSLSENLVHLCGRFIWNKVINIL